MAADPLWPTDDELRQVVLGTVMSYEVKRFNRTVYANRFEPIGRVKDAEDLVLVTVETPGHHSTFKYRLKPELVPWLEPGFRVTADMVEDPPGWPEGQPAPWLAERPTRLPEKKTAWDRILEDDDYEDSV